MDRLRLMKAFGRGVVSFAAMFYWFVIGTHAQSGLSPVINPTGLEDQRLHLLSPEGYQLIEQANQALASGMRLRAEDRINQVLYQHSSALVPLPGDPDISFRSFAAIPGFVQAWHHQVGQEDTISPRDKAGQLTTISNGLVASLKYGCFSPNDLLRTEWYLAVCDEMIARGELETARVFLARQAMVPIVGVNKSYTGKWQLSTEATKTVELKIGVRKIILEILEGRTAPAKKSIERLTQDDSEELLSIGGLSGTLDHLLLGFFQQHFGGQEPAAEFLPQTPTQSRGSRVFEGSEIWQRDFSGLLNGKGLKQKLDVRFTVVGDRVFANTMNGVLAFDSKDGSPLFGEGDDAYWLIRNNQDEIASWFDPEIPYWGNSTPAVEIVGELLAARQGDPALTHHQSVEAADIRGNSIVVLDLAEEGRMLDGFPITLPAARAGLYRVFATAPKIVGEQLLVGIRENQAFQCRHYLASYDLSGGTLNWKCYIGSARPMANRTITELVSCGLEVVGPQAIITTNTGMVASVDLSGQLNWVCTYPRSSQGIPSAQLETRTVRRSTVGFDREALAVVIAPADSELIFSVGLRSGLLLESIAEDFLALAEIMVTPNGRVLLFGDRIWQLERTEGSNLFPVAVTDSSSEVPQGVCVAGDRVYYVTGGRQLREITWNENTGEVLVDVLKSDIPNTTQLQMNQRLAILFDGKMMKAVNAAVVVPANEK